MTVMKLNQVLVVHSVQGCRTTAHVSKTLDKLDISHTVIHRSHLHKKFFSHQDLVVVVGGDGTVLRTSHFIPDKTPLLALNCDVNLNEGFFMRANRDTFQRRLRDIMDGKCKVMKIRRLKVLLNNKLLPELAVNEVFVGDRSAHHMSRYWLNGEYQKSSGVIIAAPAGTHAWYKSAGGKPMGLSSRRFAYLVREPYIGRLSRFRRVHGVLRPGQKITIESDIYNGILVVDGVSPEYGFCSGDKAVISMSEKELSLVDF
jgi:NAD+ kinase